MGDAIVDLREAQAGGAALPALGLIGETAIREAFAGDFMQLGDLLRVSLRQLLKLQGDADPYPFIRAVFADSIVVERDGGFWRYPYTVDGTAVTFGAAERVIQSYEAPGAAAAVMEAAGAFLEAKSEGKGATAFRVRIIRAGLSGNGNYYPDAVLREAAPLFENARVFVKSDEEHLAGKGKDVRNLVGRLANVGFVEGQGTDTGELQGELQMLQPAGDVAVKLREAWDRGMAGLFGFSIDAKAQARRLTVGGRSVQRASKFVKVNSVDLIVEPGAGGEVIDCIEAAHGGEEGKKLMDREQIISLLEAQRPDLLAGKDVHAISDGDLQALLREAVVKPAAPKELPDSTSADPAADAVRVVEARFAARDAVAGSGLPPAAQTRVLRLIEAAGDYGPAAVGAAIKGEKEYLASFTESGAVRGLGMRIEPGESRDQKVAQMLEAFFDPSHKDHGQARSFKECYVQITGDRLVTGLRRHCDEALMREALGTAELSDVLGNAIHRRMIADYRTPDVYGAWRQVVTVGNAVDFRSHERARVGGYGDLPAVAEGADYTALTSPSDEKVSMAVTKRGGLETLTLEAIKNDDVGMIRMIPLRLSRAGKRTLAKFVFDFIRTNPVIYDGTNLFTVGHGNLGSAALAAASYAAARLAMIKQTELDDHDTVGVGPKFLLVPPDLEETGADLFRRNTEQDKTFLQSLSPTIIPVWYWSDANDWAAMADPLDVPTIEIAFLDGNEEPELFVQDAPNAGSMFAADKMTWKIRHIYGGAVTDFRGAYKAVVA